MWKWQLDPRRVSGVSPAYLTHPNVLGCCYNLVFLSAEESFLEADQLLLADCQGDGVSELQESNTQGPGGKELHVHSVKSYS